MSYIVQGMSGQLSRAAATTLVLTGSHAPNTLSAHKECQCLVHKMAITVSKIEYQLLWTEFAVAFNRDVIKRIGSQIIHSFLLLFCWPHLCKANKRSI